MPLVSSPRKGIDCWCRLPVSRYHFQFALKSQRSIFVHLAMGMVVDLELNKSPFARRRLMTAREADNGFEISTDALCDHTLEEKRTFLGCLYLSSVYESFQVMLSLVDS